MRRNSRQSLVFGNIAHIYPQGQDVRDAMNLRLTLNRYEIFLMICHQSHNITVSAVGGRPL
jgi:hypothetical protein